VKNTIRKENVSLAMIKLLFRAQIRSNQIKDKKKKECDRFEERSYTFEEIARIDFLCMSCISRALHVLKHYVLFSFRFFIRQSASRCEEIKLEKKSQELR